MSRSKPLNVYVIGGDDGPQKIGVSDSLDQRVLCQQTTVPKLTAPQREFLLFFRPGEARGICLSYAPAKKLITLGLLATHEQRFGGTGARLTAEGERVREALA